MHQHQPLIVPFIYPDRDIFGISNISKAMVQAQFSIKRLFNKET